MAASQHQARHAHDSGQDLALTVVSLRPSVPRQLVAVEASGEAPRRAVLSPVRRLLTVKTGMRIGMGTTLDRWRPLLGFWFSVVAVVAVGISVLEVLGPPDSQSAIDPAPQQPQLPAEPSEPALRAAAPPPPAIPEPTPRPPLPTSAPTPEGIKSAAIETATPVTPNRPLVVFHPPRTETGREAARQLAAQAGLTADQVTTEAVADPAPRATIRFYSTADHPLARRLGRELAQLGYTWQIENLASRPASPGQPLEVWLPKR